MGHVPQQLPYLTSMKKTLVSAVALAVGIVTPHAAVIIGSDSFNYANGGIANQSGGIGWDYQRTDEGHTNGASDWEGTANVSGNALVTNTNNAGFREYSGISEGSTLGTGEHEGAFQGTGSFFYGVSITLSGFDSNGNVNQFAGISSFDFGTERVFFGMVGAQLAGEHKFGIAGSAAGGTFKTTIDAVAGVTYRLVAQVDFDNNTLRLWVNPDGSDNMGTADAITTNFTSTSWSSRVRLASGGFSGAQDLSATWDDLIVTTSSVGDPDSMAAFAAAAAIPEPSVAVLGGIGLLGLLRRRRA